MDTYSFTQISHYLGCPLRYKYRYLEGWREKPSRASLHFGRAFEAALGALFLGHDPVAEFHDQWQPIRELPLDYTHGDSWEKMLRQAERLLERFVQDNRVRIRNPRRNLQLKLVQPMSELGKDFVAYIDAIGQVDGTRSVIEWKTTTSRYPTEPAGLLALDPQLVCYSWLTGILDVAAVVFLRKRQPEVQYLRATISEDQQAQFGDLVRSVIQRIETGEFLPRSGIRFPQNGCLSCAHLGLCLNDQALVEARLVRLDPGQSHDWLDELEW
ncbi:MAG: PD-(D/E)XK nuclease family protein [Chloroflexota bacterium]